jgi:hypothetical protein
MAKVRIKHPDTGMVYERDVKNLTPLDLERLKRVCGVEEVEEKPKRKKKKMSDKHRTTEYYKNVDNTEENGEAKDDRESV